MNVIHPKPVSLSFASECSKYQFYKEEGKNEEVQNESLIVGPTWVS